MNNDVNQEFYDEGKILDDINKEEERNNDNENKKRNYISAFESDDNESKEEEEKENDKAIKNDQNDYRLIDELKIEAVVSFSDDLISNRKPPSTSKSSFNKESNGINFKRFKKAKFIKNNDVIDRGSLFYYEDNKISEEWLMDNETKEKKSSTSEAILLKTNTLLNTHTLRDGNIDSMFNSVANNSLFVVDDNNHIQLTENDVKKKKTTKKVSNTLKKNNKNKPNNDILIFDSDDDEDEKFVWN